MKISPAVAILLVGVAGIGAYLLVRPKTTTTAPTPAPSSKSSGGGGTSTATAVVQGLASIATTAISGYFGSNSTNSGNSTEA